MLSEQTKNLDSGFLLSYNADDYSQVYGQIKEAFRALTKNNIIQPCISVDDFRPFNEDNNFGCNIHVFLIRHQKNFESAQPVKPEFKIAENIPAGIYGYALVLRNILASISSDGQRLFDLS